MASIELAKKLQKLFEMIGGLNDTVEAYSY
jgi:hypothetical protein